MVKWFVDCSQTVVYCIRYTISYPYPLALNITVCIAVFHCVCVCVTHWLTPVQVLAGQFLHSLRSPALDRKHPGATGGRGAEIPTAAQIQTVRYQQVLASLHGLRALTHHSALIAQNCMAIQSV